MITFDYIIQKTKGVYKRAIDSIKKDSIENVAKFRNVLAGSLYDRRPSNSLGQHIMRRLGHISISPKDAYNISMLKECYVYHTDDKYINTEANTKKLIERIIENETINGWLDGTHVFLLHQARGGGKTFYINHIFAKYKKDFDDNRIIFIRANLVNSFESKDEYLQEWLLAQLLRIVLRHHDLQSKAFIYKGDEKSSMVINACAILDEIVDEVEPDLRDNATAKIDLIKNLLMQERPTRAIIQGDIPEYISFRFSQKILEKGYRLFFIIDGLDRVEPLVHFKQKYNSLLNQIGPVIMDERREKVIYAIVTRTCNLETIKDRLKIRKDGGGITSFITEDNILEIGVVKSQEIMRRRIECLLKEIDKILNDINLNFCDNKDAAYWKKHLKEFLGYLNYSANSVLKKVYDHVPERTWDRYESYDDYFEYLENTFYKNNRAKAQFTQCNYFNFLNKMKLKKYMLVESLVLAGQEIPPISYEYKYNEENKALNMYSGNNYFDNNFLPNIFIFPHDKDYYKYPELNTPLMGLRILQMVVSHSQYNLKAEIKLCWKISDYINVLNKLFNYDKKVMLRLFEEYLEGELVSTDINLIRPHKTEDYFIYPSPKTQYYLESLIFDVAYLNLCSMRVLINPMCIIGKIPYFNAISFSNASTKQWVRIKLFNSVGLFQIIEETNRREKDIFLKNKTLLSKDNERKFDYKSNQSFFLFIDKLESELRTQIYHLLNPFMAEQKDFVSSILVELKDYSELWLTNENKTKIISWFENLDGEERDVNKIS